MNQNPPTYIPSGAEIATLVKQSMHVLPWKRTQARAALLDFGDEAVPLLVAEFSHAFRYYREGQKRRTLLYLVFLLGLSLYLAGPVMGKVAIPSWLVLALYAVFFGPVLLMLYRFVTPAETKIRCLLQSLVLFDDVRIVGSLVDALAISDDTRFVIGKTTSDIVWSALKRLLPRLRREDGVYLNDEQRKRLTLALVMGDSEKTLLVMHTLTVLGDTRALPLVRRLANAIAVLPASRRIRDEAQRCLPILEAIEAEERESKTLLRGASAPDAPTETLLRPMRGHFPAEEPQQLLRAAQKGRDRE